MAELNIAWHKLPLAHRLPERTRGWWETLHMNHAYHKDDDTDTTYQPGGVAIFSLNQAAHRVVSKGADTSGMGRWCWTKYIGKQQITLRIIAAYRAVLNRTGPLSAYNRQRRMMYTNDDDRCPRQAFIDDLLTEIDQWINAGEQLILVLDANEKVGTSSLQLRLQELGLFNLHAHHGGPDTPATYNRGTETIDAIFVTRSLLQSQSGYLPFGDAIPSDHRALWMDISYDIAFGNSLLPVVIPRARRLKCNDPRIVAKYLAQFRAFIIQHNLAERAFYLQQQASTPLSPAQAQEWENIDKLRVQGMLHAEKHCRHLHLGNVPWSPQLQQAIDEITFWQVLYRHKSKTRIGKRFLNRAAKKAGIDFMMAFSRTLTDIQEALNSSRQNYRILRKKASQLRTSWIESLAAAKAANGQGSAASHLNTLLNHERQRQAGRRIRQLTAATMRGGLTLVQEQRNDGTWQEHTSQHDIEDACFRENARRFRQASTTPFMTEPLMSSIGLLGNNEAIDAILAGTYNIPPETDLWATQLIKHLRRPLEVQTATPPSLYIPTELYINGWKKSKEQTSSGPSGLHFGHFKAGCLDPLIADFSACMANIPYATGYSPKRWQVATAVELVKKPGNFKVTDLRTIILYEADFNANNKLLGRTIMSHAEQLGQLAVEQYGSRKALSAVEHCLNKHLSYDLLRQKRACGALCSNDAKSCYDRIVHIVAILSMLKAGMPLPPIHSMFDTIQKLKLHVRTAFGDSSRTSGGDPTDSPVHGVGQGNGAGPAIWALVSTPIFQMLRELGFGTHIISAITKELVEFAGYAFVDDADIITTVSNLLDDSNSVAQVLQQALDSWEGGIRATGGAIVPQKSYWYLIAFIWVDGVWRYATNNESPATLSVRDTHGERQRLERLEPSEARRTLGVRLAPDGNCEAEYQHLLTTGKAWADNIRTGHLPRYLAWQALTMHLYPKLRYPLPTTIFSKKQCDAIMQPILQAFLPAAGICRNFPRALVYAPIKYQGLGLPNLYTTQGIAHIHQVLTHAHKSSSITGKLLRASLEQLMLELGLPGNPLLHDFRQYGLLGTKSWIHHLWEFCSTNNIHLRGHLPDLPLKRTNDDYLMKKFSTFIKGRGLLPLNRCRLYLQALTLSDITQGSGSAILSWAWEGRLSPIKATYEWPNQGRPSQSDWILWRRALIQAFGITSITTRKLSLTLGTWKSSLLDWKWFLSRSESRLYNCTSDGWVFYPRQTGHSRRTGQFRTSRNPTPIQEDDLPFDLERTVIDYSSTQFFATGSASIAVPPASDTESCPNIFSNRDAYPPPSRWAVQDTVLLQPGHNFAYTLSMGGLYAVSNGSYKDQFGTASWIIATTTGQSMMQGDVITPGLPSDQSSYRSELSGIYAIVFNLHQVCQALAIPSGSVTVGCDNITALKHCFQHTYVPKSTQPHYDMLAAIRSLIAQTPLTWSYVHVPGHQDSLPGAVLDIWGALNVEMDKRAKAHWHHHFSNPHNICQHAITSEPWSVWLYEKKLSTDLDQQLIDHIHGQLALHWWERKGRFCQPMTEFVDWEACRIAMNQLQTSRRHWIAKHTAGMCGVGKMMHLWQEWSHSNCPRCGEFEDAPHVWKCQEHTTNSLWDSSIEKLRDWMIGIQTQPDIVTYICTRLTSWRNSTAGPAITTTFLGLPEAVNKQDEVGWQSFFEGCVVYDLATVQQTYYTWIGIRRSGRRWLIQLILKLWNIAWDLWEHRNGILHDKSVSALVSDSHRQAIRHEISLGPINLLPTDLPLFNRGPVILNSNQPEVQEAWLQSIQTARLRATRRDAASFRPERQFMQRWLSGANSTNNSTST